MSARPVLLPLGLAVLVQAFSIAIVNLFSVTNISVGSFQPYGTSTVASLGASITIVIPMGLSAFFFLWLTRRRKFNILRTLLVLLTTLSSFLLSFVSGELLFLFWKVTYPDIASAILGSAAAMVVAYAGLKPGSWVSRVAVLILSAEIGGFLAMIVPVPTIFLLPAVVSAYDVYAVFRGPLGKLIDSADSDVLSPIAASIGGVQVGLGDLAFYAMVAAKAFDLVSVPFAIVTFVALNAGVVVTLLIAPRKRTIPGLPVPMLLGVTTLFLAWFLSL